MSITITIQGTPIQFPSSGESPNWAPAVIQFAEAVEIALQSVVGPGDVAAQVTDVNNNQSVALDIPALSFATGVVRSADVYYYVYRTTNSSTLLEQGKIRIAYNPSNNTNEKWELVQTKSGDAGITFDISDSGTFNYTSSNQAGTNYSGKIGFMAKALTQT